MRGGCHDVIARIADAMQACSDQFVIIVMKSD